MTTDTSWLVDSPQVRHVHSRPARTGSVADWPRWLPAPIRQACQQQGIVAPWRHQVEVAENLFAGRHTVVSTGTASGKTLSYLLPVMAACYGGPEATAGVVPATVREQLVRPRRPHTSLYLAPTKALAHDQLRVCTEFGLDSWSVATLDGDTERPERDWAREHASSILTNPDMLHRSLLPQHARWGAFLSSLRYVVIDECHRYRGVFGAQVAAVIRRLRRICAAYGSDPTFVLASATSTNASEAAAELVGVSADQISLVDHDSSPHGALRMVLWEPDGAADDDAAMLLARLVDEDRQTLAFIGSRKMAELVAVRAQDLSSGHARVEAYRSGYLAADRRALERALQDRTLRGVAATNALELGVDIAGMDAVIISGFPGTRAALWQQAGRAGRSGADATVVLIARQQPLDAYLFDHPELLLATPVEATVLHADNPYVLGPHLAAAAQEIPLTPADQVYFGPSMPALLDRLVAQQTLRRRPTGWFWTRTDRAVDHIDLRAMGGKAVEIVEIDTGRVIGHVDPAAADGTVHPGAVYLHQGDTYLCEELDLAAGEAMVRPARPGYYTQPRVHAGISIVAERRTRAFGRGAVHFGEVDVSSQVVGYLRRDEVTGDVWDETALDLPERRMRTTGMWWTLDPAAIGRHLNPTQLAGAAHAAEHTAIGLLPMFAPCDRWDIGGLSMLDHPDTQTLTVFVHDGQAGGAGFAERGYEVAGQWLPATLERLRSCECASGCPSCVVSPKCGNANQMLDKQAAMLLLAALCETARPAVV
ncbi:DEAD/DEAH box helicase [Microlunatus panaciterrae]|uniref:DEAD/DEAH box helicase domain-containing protein n=1 Tax=Microlunatus panaciterrae TaxID=400768 RepID=A0ABS2RJS8_9ACTN|nr:DEAD/DEAH box helicase [Microlunatus panaciterrae]MBM7799232.1 DEAD/DEAH box helicase domain-containing protein [Microlunatus panaciterrae]